jgi:hypothetical protein
MLNGKTIEKMNKNDVNNILRTYGYGIPNLEKALYSASNSLTLIAEEYIKPFQKGDSNIKYNEIHYYELPWPKEVLENALSDTDVTLNITLSYFIEPNPGNRIYANKFNYQSHGLRFSLIKPEEDRESFKKRVNGKMREKEDPNFPGEKWLIGSSYRNKGSIHRDLWKGSGAELATRNFIAIYPVYGWYRNRKKMERYDETVRYSLIVSIETPATTVDIYNPVKNMVEIEI